MTLNAKCKYLLSPPLPAAMVGATGSLRPGWLCVLLCAVLLLLPTVHLCASEDAMQRVDELEQKVAALEVMVQQLLQHSEQQTAMLAASQQSAAAASAAAISARAQTEALSERAEPVLARAETQAAGPEFFWGGYIKADVLLSDYDDGDVPIGNIGRDFLVPSTIPVGGTAETTDLDFHTRQTRLFAGTRYRIDDDHVLGSYVEMDFLVTPGGNERVSNSFVPRMRHAYLTYNNWLIGQTWNTFMDVATLPDVVDFIGPSGSTSFGREPMIRYSKGGFAVALENPETTVSPNGGGAQIVADDSLLPDLAMRYTWKRDWGHLQVAGLLRRLELENATLGVDDRELSWGLSLSGKLNVGADDLRWMLIHGDGLGREVGLNFANGAVITDDQQLASLGTTGGFAAYRHVWHPQWRSTAVFSYMAVDNPVQFTGIAANKNNWSSSINLMYSPVSPLTFGVEFIHAERELESSESGQLNRLQFMGKYTF